MRNGFFLGDIMEQRSARVHFVGIGGVGMGAIAEVLHQQGYCVSGSDQEESAMVKRLVHLGMNVTLGHREDNVLGANVVVLSAAVCRQKNPEARAAMACGIPVVSRAEMLAEMMRFKRGVAVSGTHGKTTTTSLIASIFETAKAQPSFVIGGRLNSLGANAKRGKGKYFIAEADESDASFLHLRPMIAVVTNIDADHMETYEGNLSCLKETFLRFIHQLPFYGWAVLCADDPGVQSLLPSIKRSYLTYGEHPHADYRLLSYQAQGLRTAFHVKISGEREVHFELNLPGHHNVLNALAAIAVADRANIPMEVVQRALSEFSGVGRRFEVHGHFETKKGLISLVEDYGHHPREVAATLEAARSVWPKRRVVNVFQPHRYSRTHDLFDDFVDVLSQSDLLVLLDVYSAGEPVIHGADGVSLAHSIQQRASQAPVFVPQLTSLPETLAKVVQDQDVLLFQGAGNIGRMALQLAKSQLDIFPSRTTIDA